MIYLVPLLLAACTDVTENPTGPGDSPATSNESPAAEASCTGTIEWNTGSVPPPWNHGWSIALDEDLTLDFEFHANYVDDGDLYEAGDIPITAEQAAAICDTYLALENKDFDGEGGDATVWELNGQRGHSLASGREMAGAHEVALKPVGDHWDKAQAAYKEWEANYGQ